jgi:uncharacterized protein YaeQ
VASFTTWNFELEISDLDRGVYASEHISVAQHPSETPERLVARILAFALEFTEGIKFAGDLSSGDEPAAWVHDLTGALTTWIEVGAPSPERVHRASKAADRVAIYNHKEPEPWLTELRAFRVFAPQRVWVHLLPPALIDPVAAALQRRNRWSVSRTEGTLYLEADGQVIEAEVQGFPL